MLSTQISESLSQCMDARQDTYAYRFRVDACLSARSVGKVAEGMQRVVLATLVWINPVIACRGQKL